MLQKLLKICAILFFCLVLTTLQAQTNINTSGGNASGNGGTSSYSVGQTVYTTNADTNASVAEGVQQPYEISVVIAIEEAKSICLSIGAYPNPTDDYLTLNIGLFDYSNLNYQMFDMQGKILDDKKITSIITNINLSELVSGNYLLKVLQGSKNLITFKIIKN